MKITLDHTNFDDVVNDCRAGKCNIYLPTAYRVTIVDAKTVKKFETLGLNVLKKSMDGKGFRIARGKHNDYVFSGILVAVYP